MKRVELIVAYDGTHYCGWQIQPNGITIEEVLNQELSRLLKETITVDGASRTDSGVHALGNIAVFDTESRMPAEKISYALNQSLPEDIRIQGSREVPLDFHPRKCNSIKTYEYKILNREFALPTSRLYSYFYHVPLDVGRMRAGAAYLVGEHDFCSFCSAKGQAKDTVRTIYSLEVEKAGELITIRITGNGFLYNMVRIIAGSLIEVGRGFREPEWIREVLEARDRTLAGRRAPAEGLTLVNYQYDHSLAGEIASSNRFWDYRLIQREIPDRQQAVLLINRCQDEEFLPLVERKTLQATRNGAKKVFAVDLEKRKRLEGIQRLGWFQVSFSHSMLELQLDLCGNGEAVLKDRECGCAACVAAMPVTADTAEEYLELVKQCFQDSHGQPAALEGGNGFGSGRDALQALRSRLEDSSRFTAFLKKGDEAVGFFQMTVDAEKVEIDGVGIRPQYAGHGLGRAALAYAVLNAAQMHKKTVSLSVSSDNQRMLHLCETMGFFSRGETERWFCLEEIPRQNASESPNKSE